MFRSRIAHRVVSVFAGVIFGLFMAIPTAGALTRDTPGPTPAVTQAGNDFSVSLPGIGVLTFTVDPTTGAVTNLMAIADPAGGFAAGTPKVSDGGVEIKFTSPTQTQVLQVEVDREDGAVKVTAESEADQPEANEEAKTPPTTEVNEHGNVQNQQQGEHKDDQGESPSTTVAKTQKTTTPTTEAEHDGGGKGASGNAGAGSHGGDHHDSGGDH